MEKIMYTSCATPANLLEFFDTDAAVICIGAPPRGTSTRQRGELCEVSMESLESVLVGHIRYSFDGTIAGT